MKYIQSEKQNKIKKKKGILKSGATLKDNWDNIKQINTCIIGVPKGEKRKKGPGNLFEELIVDNFSNLRKKTGTDAGSTESSK